jgi:hypothetical protein
MMPPYFSFFFAILSCYQVLAGWIRTHYHTISSKVLYQWRRDNQYNDTEHEGLSCDTQHRSHLA